MHELKLACCQAMGPAFEAPVALMGHSESGFPVEPPNSDAFSRSASSHLPIQPPSTTRAFPRDVLRSCTCQEQDRSLEIFRRPPSPSRDPLQDALCPVFVPPINAAFTSVATYPGAMALTEMPLTADSFDRALVSCDTPPLEAAYAGTVKPPLPYSLVVSISSLSSGSKLFDTILRIPRMGEPRSRDSDFRSN